MLFVRDSLTDRQQILSHLWVCGYVGFGERFESSENEGARERASGKRTFILGGRGRHHRLHGDGSVIIVLSDLSLSLSPLFLQRTARDSVRRRGILLCCSVDLEEAVASCPFPFPFFSLFAAFLSSSLAMIPFFPSLYVFSVSLFFSHGRITRVRRSSTAIIMARLLSFLLL